MKSTHSIIKIEKHESGRDELTLRRAHWMVTLLTSNFFISQPKFRRKLWIFFICLFCHSIIEKAKSYGQVDHQVRKRLDSESENRKERKTISIPVEEVQWKAFDPEMVSKLARQTSSEELEIYSTCTLSLFSWTVLRMTMMLVINYVILMNLWLWPI